MNRRDVILGATALAGCASMNDAAQIRRPIVIAHRGASAYRPEHTLAGYLLAIEQGADFIEPDLVMTKDHVLVCRHENEISGTTDVADHPEFAERRKAKTVDGAEALGWWVEDFTLAELKTLRARERIPQLRPANTEYNDQFEIPTFAEALALAQQHGKGIYPELKHPTFLREQGLDPVPAFISAVREGGGQSTADIMYVQCFEVGAIRTLAQMSSIRWQCVQLASVDGGPWDQRDTTYAAMLEGDGLRRVAEYARGIGVEKPLIIPRDAGNNLGAPTDLVARAHAANLVVHPWTFRPENFFLPTALRVGATAAQETLRQRGNLDAELCAFYAAGVDGVFSDDPAAAVAARN
ncbi:MAG: glycerophosphodiester phosphodiesterase [Caulobacteraceae bacterium]|nr:glycerophosphodiester phosphodiesterase [Caulobacteraceae bacterium]